MSIKKWLIPELATLYPWTTELPRAMRDGAVREACDSVIRAIRKYKDTGQVSRVRHKSRKEIQQSFPLRNDKWSKDRRGFCVRSLGEMRFHEVLPERLRDGRVIRYGENWYVALPVAVKTRRAENQGRLVALDPGVRTFLTWFADGSAGFIGAGAFARIARLAVWLDRLISKRAKATSRRRKASLTRAINRHRERMKFLVDELHWKAVTFLVQNFDVILLPTFETQQMVVRTARRIRSKTVRSMLTLSHYRFAQRLEQKAFELGKRVVRVCEAYTSKTASWTGEIIHNLGGRKWIESGGVVVDRDINGARGIFLRALVDSPILAEAGVRVNDC